MSTRFKKLEADADQLIQSLATIQSNQQCKQILEHANEISENDAFDTLIEQTLDQLKQVSFALESIQLELDPIHKRALEKDEDKKVYGETMVKKVLSLAERVAKFQEDLTNARQVWEALFVPIKRRKDLAAQKLLEEEARRKQAELEENLRQQKIRDEQAKKEAEWKRQRKLREEQERIERERIAEEKAKLDRQLFEAEREIRQQRKAEEESIQSMKNKRLEDAKTMDLDDVLNLMENSNSEKNFETMVITLNNILENIINLPEDPKFRHIRKENDAIKRDLTNFEGGLEALMCLGFREKELKVPTNETYYVLSEPNTETEMDQWMEWFDRLQSNKKKLERFI